MSTGKPKGNNLPSLQKRILLYLAKHEPQTINETVKGIRSSQYRSSYKSSWTAFNSLEKKGLIKKADVKTYRGREYPRFWLSSAGVFMALVQGASAQDLLEKAAVVYPDDRVLQCILEMAPFSGVERYRTGLSTILAKGKLEEFDATMMMMAQMQDDLSGKELIQVFKLLQKYPEQYKRLKEQIELLTLFLNKMERLSAG
jgi:hypothetical protein